MSVATAVDYSPVEATLRLHNGSRVTTYGDGNDSASIDAAQKHTAYVEDGRGVH